MYLFIFLSPRNTSTLICVNLQRIIPQPPRPCLMWLNDTARPSQSRGSFVTAFIFFGYFSPDGLFVVACPWAPFPGSRAAEFRASWEIARNGLRVHSWFDIISIRTSGANQGGESKQRKLRCLKGFHNKEKKPALRQYEIHKWTRMQRWDSASALVNDSQKSCQPSPYVTPLRRLPSYPLSLADLQ